MGFNLGHCSISASSRLHLWYRCFYSHHLLQCSKACGFLKREVIKLIKLIPGHQRSTGAHSPVKEWYRPSQSHSRHKTRIHYVNFNHLFNNQFPTHCIIIIVDHKSIDFLLSLKGWINPDSFLLPKKPT